MGANDDSFEGHRLSSAITPILKTVVVALLVFAIAYMFYATIHIFGPLVGVVVALPFSAFGVWLLARCARLKKVVSRKDGLIVSGYFRSISIPYADIVELKEFRRRGSLHVTLRLSHRTPIGSSIRFVVPSMFPSDEGPYAEFRDKVQGQDQDGESGPE